MSSPANNILLGRQAAKKPPATEERKERREVPHAFSVTKDQWNESVTDARTSSSIRRDHRGDIRFPPRGTHRCAGAHTEFRQTSPWFLRPALRSKDPPL